MSKQNFDLYFTLENLSPKDKLLVIKKQPYMGTDYPDFLIDSLVKDGVANDITFSRDVIVDIGGKNVETIGIILYDSNLKKSFAGYLISTITLQYLEKHGLHGKKESSISDAFNFTGLTDNHFAIEDYKVTSKNTDTGYFSDLKYFSDSNLTSTQNPSYIAEYPICPNVAISAIRNAFLDSYENYVKLTALKRLNKPELHRELQSEKETVDALYNEYKKIVHLRKDCIQCSKRDNCDVIE